MERRDSRSASPAVVVFLLALACGDGSGATEERIRAATAYVEQGDLSSAEATLLKAVTVDPNSARAWDLLGFARFRAGNLVGAEEAVRSAVRLEGNSATYRNNLGYYLLELRNPAAAVEQLVKAVELDPKLELAKNNLAVARERVGLEKLIPDPSSADAWTALALARHEAQDLPSALEATRRALAIDPNSFYAQNNLGYFLLESGQVASAVVELEKAVQLEPTSELARNNLALAKSR